jgi:hypothetical protein
MIIYLQSICKKRLSELRPVRSSETRSMLFKEDTIKKVKESVKTHKVPELEVNIGRHGKP